MYNLTDAQIDKILNVIRIRGVETEDLQLNLLDHVCCIIESEYKEQSDFDQYCEEVLKRFYKKELREIEEETQLLLTFKHFYAMKKIMLGAGLVSAISIFSGAVLKFLHLPFAGISLVLGIAIFSLIFLPLMFTLKFRESKHSREKSILLMAIPLCISIIFSILLKIMHWPYANLLTQVSLCYLLILFLPVYLITGLRNADTKTNTITTSILLIAGGGLMLSLATIHKSNYQYAHEMHIALQMHDAALKDRAVCISLMEKIEKPGDSVVVNDARIPFLNATLELANYVQVQKLKLQSLTENELNEKLQFPYPAETEQTKALMSEIQADIDARLSTHFAAYETFMKTFDLKKVEADWTEPRRTEFIIAFSELTWIEKALLDQVEYVAR
jgi:hypothetical protein